MRLLALLLIFLPMAHSQSPDLRIAYLEARVANAEAVARFQQSLSADQKAMYDESTKAATTVNQADKAIVEACKSSGQDLKRKANGEPYCVEKPAPAMTGTESPKYTPDPSPAGSNAQPTTGAN